MATLALVGCERQAPTIVIDNNHNVPYAKINCESAEDFFKINREIISLAGCDQVTACQDMTKEHDACSISQNNSGGVYEYVSDLETAFATQKECTGVKVVILHEDPIKMSKEIQAVVSAPYWELQIDFVPGEREQSWSMFTPATNHLFQAHGNVDEAAKAACLIARQSGANVAG